MTTAERIKKRRTELGMSQFDLAKKMGYKGKSSISKIENSGDNITLKIVTKVSNPLKCSVDYLMGWSDDDTNKEFTDIRNISEEKIVLYYRDLNNNGKKLVDNFILETHSQAQSLKKDFSFKDTLVAKEFLEFSGVSTFKNDLLSEEDILAMANALLNSKRMEIK